MPGVMTDSPQYDTGGDWLPAVRYCKEIDSAQYDTLRRFLRNIWLTGEILRNCKYFNWINQWPRQVRVMKKTGGQKSCWNVTLYRIWKTHMTPCSIEIENILTRWSMVSGPGRFEWWKKWGSKTSLDCLFKL